MNQLVTKNDVKEWLLRLGLNNKDVVMVHSSLSSFSVMWRAEQRTVVDALTK